MFKEYLVLIECKTKIVENILPVNVSKDFINFVSENNMTYRLYKLIFTKCC